MNTYFNISKKTSDNLNDYLKFNELQVDSNPISIDLSKLRQDYFRNTYRRKNLSYSEKLVKVKEVFEKFMGDVSVYNSKITLFRQSEGCTSAQFKILEGRQGTWFGWFVSKLNHNTGIISTIKNLLCRISTSFKKEATDQDKIVEAFSLALKKSNQYKDDSLKHFQETKKEFDAFFKLKDEYSNLVNNQNADDIIKAGNEKMWALFGGIDEYNKLPILDIGDRQGETGYIDFIKPKELSAPIMRGTDCSGREFFTMRAKINQNYFNDDTARVQTFFQREKNIWTSGGDEIVAECSYLIDINEYNEESYNKLADFITSRNNNIYVLS